MNPPGAARSDRKNQATEENLRFSKEASLYKLPKQKGDVLAQAWGLQEPKPFGGSPSRPGGSQDHNLHHGGNLQR